LPVSFFAISEAPANQHLAAIETSLYGEDQGKMMLYPRGACSAMATDLGSQNKCM
jgi:hypothetical protein